VWSGYLVGGIVVFRVVWGFVGSRHARFRDFVYEPFKILAYLTDLLRGRAHRYVGHSPAGGAMVVALLVCLAGTVATGIVSDGEQGKGPLAAAPVTDTTTKANGNEAHRTRPEAGGEGSESVIREVHDLLADITMALVVAHILGVALASFVHRENLVLAMISGRKRRAGD
jgi:cytochrome b